MEGHFDSYIRSWGDLGAPLRPDASALRAYRQLFQNATDPRTSAHVLLLGVTPELAGAEWLESSHLTALDQSANMIGALWVGDSDRRKAMKGDWFSPPIAPASQDVVLGDGVLNLLSYPLHHQQFSKSMAAVLRERGHLILRAFCPPEPLWSPEDLLRKAESGELKNFHEFKLLLLAALQRGQVRAGVELASVWQVFDARFPDVNVCAQKTAWPVPAIRTMGLYQNNPTRYFLASPREIEEALSQDFDLVQHLVHEPDAAAPHPLMCFRKR